MKPFRILISILLTTLTFCSEKEEPKPDLEETFWIYSYHWPCDPFNEDWSPCFAVQRTAEFDFSKIIDQSETVGLGIKNFNFEPGNLYRIKVSSSSKKPDELTLGEVVERKKDYLNELLGNWQIIEVFGISYPNEDFPDYEGFSVYGTPRRISGTNGCTIESAVFGKIEQSSLEILVPIEFGEGVCEKVIPSGQAINESVKYQVVNNTLNLFNNENQLIMKLKK